MDKLTESDRSAMHEAMEQQTISIAKAGIQATLNSRCSILGAANPKQGRFRIGQPKHEQINLPPPLRSRFDLIFTISDIPNARTDRELAEAMLRRHRIGEEAQIAKFDDRKRDQMEESTDSVYEEGRPALDVDVLKKYIAYSKRKCFPVLTKEASAEIIDFYVNLREKNSQLSGGEEGGVVALTARQLEALVRLAEASARVRLSPQVTLEDAKNATDLMEWSLKDVAMTDSGIYDIDGIIGSGFKSQKDKMYEILTIIREYQTTDGRITRAELRQRAEERNISENELDNYLKKLQDEGAVYEPRTGEFSIL
jgi:replicative DNA helicase Mcm